MAECLHERRERLDIRAWRKLGLHAMCTNHDSPSGGLRRYYLNRQLFRFYSDKHTSFVLRLTKGFFLDDSQPVIVAVFMDSVLQAPRPHTPTALLPLMNQLSPPVYSRDLLCFPYRHVFLSIVFQVCLFFWIPVFQVLWISIARFVEVIMAQDY